MCYLLETVVGDAARAGVLRAELGKIVRGAPKPVPLDRRGRGPARARDHRWGIVVNCTVERDET